MYNMTIIVSFLRKRPFVPAYAYVQGALGSALELGDNKDLAEHKSGMLGMGARSRPELGEESLTELFVKVELWLTKDKERTTWKDLKS